MPAARRKSNREIEVKLRIGDLAALLRELRQSGARRSKTVFERDVLFDTRGRDFSRRRAVLRIRAEVPASPPRGNRRMPPKQSRRIEGLLTYKGMPPKAACPHPRYKIREEIEYRLPNSGRFERLLRSLGLAPWFRYEKYRTSFSWPRLASLHVDLDETPIGTFLELEGPPKAIDTAARALGFHPAQYITASYLELYLSDCRRRRAKPGHMVFHTKKSFNSSHSSLDNFSFCF